MYLYSLLLFIVALLLLFCLNVSFKILPCFPPCFIHLLYHILLKLHHLPRYFPLIFAIHFYYEQLSFDVLVSNPFLSLLCLFITCIIHECGHLIVLFEHNQKCICHVTFRTITLSHSCADPIIHSSGITFLYVNLLILNIIHNTPYQLIPLIECLYDSLPFRGHDGYEIQQYEQKRYQQKQQKCMDI